MCWLTTIDKVRSSVQLQNLCFTQSYNKIMTVALMRISNVNTFQYDNTNVENHEVQAGIKY